PWVVWLMWSFLEGIPHEIFEAAQADGASNLTILLQIMLPLVKPGLIVSAVFAFIQAYNDYAVASIIGGSTTLTVPVALASLASGFVQNWNTVFAIGVLNMIPTAMLLLLVRKYWARGLSMGLVK